MKVLITTDWYLPAVNGVVTSVVNLQKELTARGVDVRIVTLSEDGTYHREGNVFYLPSVDVSRIYPGARAGVRPYHRLLDELIRWHPDVVHSQCEFSTFLPARKIARICGCPLVHTYHTLYEDFIHYVMPSTMLGKRGARMLTTSICKKVQHVIVPSEKIKRLLEQYHVRTPITVIPTGIDVDRFTPGLSANERNELRKRYGISAGDTVLLYAGRLAAEKNLDELLYLFSRKAAPVNKLVFVGDGPYRQELEKMVRKMKLPGRVVFTGMVSPQDMAAYYRMGDIFVSASTSETQGLTYFEAMASELPLLCREDACLEHVLIPGKTGFAYRNEREFSKMLQMLTESGTLRENMGRQAREITRTSYSTQVFARSVLKVYWAAARVRLVWERRKIYGTEPEAMR